MPDGDSTTRNINLPSEYDQIVTDKWNELIQAGGRGLSYSAAVRALLDELVVCRKAVTDRKALLPVCQYLNGVVGDIPPNLLGHGDAMAGLAFVKQLRAALAKAEGK